MKVRLLFFCAAREGHTATVLYLIEKGADPATPSTSGAALHNVAGNSRTYSIG